MKGKDALPIAFPTPKLMELFGFNRADAGVVFGENQMYLSTLKDADGKSTKNKNINDYTFADYGLKNWKDLRANLKPLKLDTTITPANVKELFRNNAGEGLMGYEDYLKRKLILKEKNFTKHTSSTEYLNDKDNRPQLFAYLPELFKYPDEVWMNDFTEGNKIQHQFRFVKFYKDDVIVSDCQITLDGLEVRNWYYQKVDDEKLRFGLLIK